MNKIQKELLSLYKKVSKILNNNNIKFWAIGGTAIGGLRENGFIPWDDDLDICIEEEQYETAINILKKHGISLKSHFSNNHLPFNKAFNNEINISENGIKENLYIDIFPGWKERKIGNIMWLKWKIKEKILHIKSRKIKNIISKRKNIADFFFALLAKMFLFWYSQEKGRLKQIKMIKKSKIIKNEKRFIYFLRKDMWLNISEIVMVNFEDIKIPVNKSFAKDREWIFGNIYKAPPKSKRYNHNIKLLK